MRHYEHAHLLSNIEKLPLPILGSMFPFWSPTGVFLQSVAHVEKDKPSLFVAFPSIHVLRRQPRRRARGPRAPLARSTRAGIRPKMRLYLTKNDGAPSLSRRRLFGYEFGLSDENEE